MLRINGKEVIPQNAGDAYQFVGINGTLGENLVCIGPVARELPGKPYHCFALYLQLFFYKLAYMHTVAPAAEQFPGSAFVHRQWREGIVGKIIFK